MKFTEIKESPDEENDLKRQMDELRKVEVTWDDVESGTATKAQYAKWRRQYNKLSSRHIELYVSREGEEREVKNNARKARSTNPTIQTLADKLHDLTCGMDHMERCGYHYGNWENDVRGEMLSAYEDAERFIDAFGERGLVAKLDAVEAGKQAEQELSR